MWLQTKSNLPNKAVMDLIYELDLNLPELGVVLRSVEHFFSD
jgi:hypothetical protein